MVRVEPASKRQVACQLLTPHGGNNRVHHLRKPARHGERTLGIRRASGDRRPERLEALDKLAAIVRYRVTSIDVEHRHTGPYRGNRAMQEVGDLDALGEDPRSLLQLERRLERCRVGQAPGGNKQPLVPCPVRCQHGRR